MIICVFDTETTSLEKPFCYNIGYLILDIENRKILTKKSYVVEQIWHNLPLFSSAYYADKREIYVTEMRARKTTLDKFGYICRQMSRDFRYYNVEKAFAYNSPFDEKVFNYNCDWYKCINPFDTIPIIDIRGFVHSFIVDEVYKNFCEDYGLFTESGNYSTTAENVYRFISGDIEFDEAHTALKDSEIEAEILLACVDCGADLNEIYPVKRSIPRIIEKTLHIRQNSEDFYFDYTKIRINREKTEIILT